jgi:hypothetical protein
MITLLKVIYQHERNLLKDHDKLLRHLVLVIALLAHWFYSSLYLFPENLLAAPASYGHVLSLLMLLGLPLMALLGFGNDRRMGSLTFMSSQPVDEWVWYGGRFLAWMTALAPLAVLTVIWHGFAWRWYLLDAGIVFATFLELALVSAWVISLALWFSSVFSKPWLAVLATISVVILFLGGAGVVVSLNTTSPHLAQWLRIFAFTYRTEALRMGLLSLGDLWFWVGGVVVMASATVVKLKQSRGDSQRLWWPWVWLLVLVGFHIWPVEYDITASRAYQPSEAFREQAVLAQDPVIITRFLSPTLRFQPDQQRLSRLLNTYGRRHLSVYVRTVWINNEEEAASYGLRALNPLRSPDEEALFAGLFVTYQTKAVFEPVLTQINALDTALVVLVRQLLSRAPHLVVFTDDILTDQEFHFLRTSLGREFRLSFYHEYFNEQGDPISLHDLPADAYVVLSDGAITADMASDLWAFHRQGKGLFINSTQVITPMSEGAIPQRILPTPLQQLLKREGLEVGSDLLLDPDGLFLQSEDAYGQAIALHYRPWVVGRTVSAWGISSLALGINPLFSVPLLASNSRWQPWLNTSPATYLQKGVVDLSNASLLSKMVQDGSGPHTVGMAYEGNATEGVVLVLGSAVWVSDLVEMAGSWDNIEGLKQLLRHISGAPLLAQANRRFYPFTHQRKPYALHEDAFAVMWRTSLGLFGVLAWVLIVAIKGRRR